MRTQTKILGVICLIFVSFTSPALANETNKSSYNPVTLHEAFTFTATLNNEGKVEMNWKSYTPEGFNYYKVVRSTKNQNPAYPEDGYIKYSSDKDFTSYTDKSVPNGDVYYRICSIAKPNRYCSKIIKINNTKTTKEVKGETETIPELILSAEKTEKGNKLKWNLKGEAPHGFKIAISTKNENPTYPVKKGDSYHYISNPEARTYTHKAEKEKTYYYRVCKYDGNGKCLVYSNGIKIENSEATKTNNTETDKKETPFEDAKNNAYVNAIEYVRKKEIVSGYPDGSYKPDKTINRAEFTKIIIGAKFSETEIKDCISKEKTLFPDVTKDKWFAKYICVAKSKGIIKGYKDGKFKPENEINFTEAAKIINETFTLETAEEGEFWYSKYVITLQRSNFIPPSISELNKQITRAEMAEMIWRIKEGKTKLSSKILIK